ncbi:MULTISPECIES: hypothetical protein [Streptomyces]|uniref:hypothetical protein n=1 Tax=Streptomyces TaxID=1883 RepID=UPI000BF21A5B|nr:hypothetical protein [Streptomyces sp. or20]
MMAAQQGAPLPLSPVIDTGLNIWTLASVLTARTAEPGVPARHLYVRRDRGTHPFGEPAWEHK